MNKIIKYNSTFLSSCICIFKSNVPVFFAFKEENLFVNYLQKTHINYYLIFDDTNSLVASGGYEYEQEKDSVSLTWGMVAFKDQNLGYGSFLTEFRLNKIKKEFSNCNIELNTTQKTFKFYEKFGFDVIKITPNYYAKGLDRYDMLHM